MKNQASFFDNLRMSLEDSINVSLNSLRAYGEQYRHWCIAYSGGKDSTATVALVAWAVRTGQVQAPESLTVLYADTRQELPPLQAGALRLMATLRSRGINAQVVLPELDARYFVYMLGRGVPPPNNMTMRWCTPQIKIEPMHNALTNHACQLGFGEMVWNEKYEKFQYQGNGKGKILMLTGVRLGESAARDARIAVSCSKDSGECGQGWMQVQTPEALADTLAPLLHWRLCHVYDWLYFDERHGYDVTGVADVYGEDEVRTGCVGCPLASEDTALNRLLRDPNYQHLRPLTELRPLYRWLREPQNRLRKSAPELRKDGKYSKNAQRLGPITMPARLIALDKILDIQQRARVDLINAEEEARIRELIALNTWPNKWSGDEVTGAELIDAVRIVGNEVISQPLLLGKVAA